MVLIQERKNLGIQIQITEAQEEYLSSVLNSITSQTRRVRPGDTLYPNGRKYRSSHFPGFPLVQCPLLRVPRALLLPVMLLILTLEPPSPCLEGRHFLPSCLSQEVSLRISVVAQLWLGPFSLHIRHSTVCLSVTSELTRLHASKGWQPCHCIFIETIAFEIKTHSNQMCDCDLRLRM